MTDFSVRSDNVDVEQIMRQIRARIREKRGVDYTEDEIRELANVKLEKFLDPKGVRSDLLQQYREVRESSARPLVRFFRRLLNPLLKLFFNPRPVIESIQAQTRLNESEKLTFELIHNLVVELTRTTIEVRNLKMRLESMASRLDFDERRARALEGVVQYRPGVVPPLQPPAAAAAAAAAASNELDTDGNERRQRRRRRRGRRRPPFGREGAETGAGGDSPAAGDQSRVHAAEPSFDDSREPAHQTSGDADSHDDGGDGHSSES
jgi:hypothetical protein